LRPEVVPGLVWDDNMVDDALQLDIATATQGCEDNIPCFNSLNDARQGVLIGMAFQMGVQGLLGFTTFLGLVNSGQFTAAAEDLRNTRWAHQTPTRANRMATQMDSGEWV
jgi:lysozyme